MLTLYSIKLIHRQNYGEYNLFIRSSRGEKGDINKYLHLFSKNNFLQII